MNEEPSAEAAFPTRKLVQACEGAKCKSVQAMMHANANSFFLIIYNVKYGLKFSARLKRHVKPFDRMRECADGDKVYATERIVAERVHRDAAARLCFKLAANHFDGFFRVFHGEVVEHDAVCAAV